MRRVSELSIYNKKLTIKMKKNLITVLLVASVTTITAVAQENTTKSEMTETEIVTGFKTDFRSNWFVSAGAGGQVFFGDHSKQVKFGDRISPALDIAVGKWFSPTVGVRLMYSGLSAKGATQTWNDPGTGSYSTGKPVPGKFTHEYGFLCKQKFNFLTLHADIMFDVTNIIGGYSPTRVYGCAPYIGVGWGRVTSNPTKDAVIGNVGLFNMFHLSDAFDINLDVRATITNDDFDGETGRRPFDAIVSVTAGVTYRFGPRGWKTRLMKVVEYDNSAVNDLRRQVAELVARNEKLEKEKAGQVVQHTTVVNANGNYIIYFPINVSALSNADRAQLEMVAEMIRKSDRNTEFSVVGYADKATGNARINEVLSRERAQSVRKYLVDEFGISAERLKVSWQGGVDNMFFDDPSLSRVVIIRPIK